MVCPWFAHGRRYQRSTQQVTQHEHLLTDKAFVFSSEPDGSLPWLPNRVTKMFIGHRRRAGVGQFRLHDLRHFMATEMLAHGVAIVTVSQRLGHARSSTTLNVYGHCVPGADRDAANYIAQLLTSK
jgi:integrase